jgi:hypothetical protein
MICPKCKQDAPTVIREMRVICTACGTPRSVIGASMPVNVAGQPSKIGGGVASVLGWLVLGGGALVALLLGALFQALFPTVVLGYVVGGVIAFLGLLVGMGLVFGGRKLQQSGVVREQAAREQAVFAIARRDGGYVTAAGLAQALAISEADADALLTAMVKRIDGRVILDVEDDGTLRYTVPELMSGRWKQLGSDRPGRRISDGPRTATGAARDALAEAEAEAEADARARLRNRS